MKKYVLLLLLSLCVFPVTMLASSACPGDLGFSSGCSGSVLFAFDDTPSGYSIYTNSLVSVPVGENNYLVQVSNSTSSTIYSATFYWDPTVGSSQTNYSCGGSEAGDAPTYGVCD